MLAFWLRAAAEMTRLGFDAQNVIALRTMKIAAGGAAAHTEVVRMIIEKASAGAEAAAILTMGGFSTFCRNNFRFGGIVAGYGNKAPRTAGQRNFAASEAFDEEAGVSVPYREGRPPVIPT